MKLATLAVTIALVACSSPEQRAEEQLERAEEEFVEALENLMDIEDPPASRDALRDARRELDELANLWGEVLLRAAAADEAIEREGYQDFPLLDSATEQRAADLERYEPLLADATEQSVASARRGIDRRMRAARRTMEQADEIVDRRSRTDAIRQQAWAEFAKVEQLLSDLDVLDREIQEAHTDEWEKRWAADQLLLDTESRARTLASYRQSIETLAAPRLGGFGNEDLIVRQLIDTQEHSERLIQEKQRRLEEVRGNSQ